MLFLYKPLKTTFLKTSTYFLKISQKKKRRAHPSFFKIQKCGAPLFLQTTPRKIIYKRLPTYS